MEKKMPQNINHIIFWAVLSILFFLSFQIIHSYLIPLISAFVLAYVIQPLYCFLSKKMNKHLSALFSLAIPLLALLLPFIIIANTFVHQILSATSSGSIAEIIAYLSSLSFISSLNLDLQDIKSQFLSFILPIIKNTIIALPALIIGAFITLLGAYYILINWSFLSSSLKEYLTFKEKERVSREIGETTDRIVRGYLLVAILEFIIAFVGFFIAGVDYYILFPFLIAAFAFIPLLGPGLVWIPLALFYFATGNIYAGIIITITGLIISVLIDGFLAAKIAGDQARIHPLLMLVGVLGGVPLFGIFGFIIGPLILVYTIKLIQESIKQPR